VEQQCVTAHDIVCISFPPLSTGGSSKMASEVRKRVRNVSLQCGKVNSNRSAIIRDDGAA